MLLYIGNRGISYYRSVWMFLLLLCNIDPYTFLGGLMEAWLRLIGSLLDFE